LLELDCSLCASARFFLSLWVRERASEWVVGEAHTYTQVHGYTYTRARVNTHGFGG